jgi:hypothetical protein
LGTDDIRAHLRVQVVIDGLRAHGVEVVECNPPLGLDTDARVAILKQPWRLPLLAWRRAVDLGDLVAAVAADAARFGLEHLGERRLGALDPGLATASRAMYGPSRSGGCLMR